ncbi:MAG: hypothetical protein KOO66_04395 [Bacteroidales bacterium]|nr:hypothetical protein [Bacteroidales bacterium]
MFGIIGFIAFSCEKDDDEPIKLAEGYIVGFDPCTINHHYRIGYVIISTDLKDTLVTYNLSDSIYKMPANVISNISDTLYKNISDTLYKIPESYFQNYRNSTYFPDSLRYKYEVKILYLIANENEMIFNLCTTDILFLHFIQVIIKSATN